MRKTGFRFAILFLSFIFAASLAQAAPVDPLQKFATERLVAELNARGVKIERIREGGLIYTSTFRARVVEAKAYEELIGDRRDVKFAKGYVVLLWRKPNEMRTRKIETGSGSLEKLTETLRRKLVVDAVRQAVQRLLQEVK